MLMNPPPAYYSPPTMNRQVIQRLGVPGRQDVFTNPAQGGNVSFQNPISSQVSKPQNMSSLLQLLNK